MCLLENDKIAKNNFAQKVQTQVLSLIINATIKYFCSLLSNFEMERVDF